MGCVFSSGRDAAAGNKVAADRGRVVGAGDIMDSDGSSKAGSMIETLQMTAAAAPLARLANEPQATTNDANGSKNANSQQQQQQQTVMTTRSSLQVKSTEADRRGQSFSLLNLIAKGRKVIQSARVRVSAAQEDTLCDLKPQTIELATNHRTHQAPEVAKIAPNVRSKRISRAKMESGDQVSTSSIVTSTSTTTTATESTNTKRNLSDSDPSREEVILFTNIQQLCLKVVKGSIIRNARVPRISHRTASSASGQSSASAPDSAPRQSDRLAYCVFLFGSQGSCKGELAFDLVQHSPLLRTISQFQSENGLKIRQTRAQQHRPTTEECPLFHHIDVAALIITNIDARIREYLQLQSHAIQSKQLEISQHSNKQQDATTTESNQDDQEEREEEEEVESITSSSHSSSQFNDNDDRQLFNQQASDDDFSLITLSTKQRSVLELKLIKYSNCVSPKWIVGLIEAEIDRLEAKVRTVSMNCRQDDELMITLSRERVYLINLVPNQLSLFKCCLYLHQQELRLKEFKYRVSALKFERRINIKVMTKERAAVGSSSNKSSKDNQQSGNNNKSTIKTITSSLSVGSGKKQPQTSSGGDPAGSNNMDKDLTVIATDALSSGLNEKLGPKLNDVFVEQFRAMSRLHRARYNRSEDDHDNFDEEQQCCTCSSSHDGSFTTEHPLGTSEQEDTKCSGDDIGQGLLSVCKFQEKVLSSSMQNLHVLSPTPDSGGMPMTSASNQQPRLSLCVSPPSPSADLRNHQLSPNSLISLSSLSADNSLASGLTTSGESLSSIEMRPAASTQHPDDLESVVEIQLVDYCGEQDSLSPSDHQVAHNQSSPRTQRWRFGHFGAADQSMDSDAPTAIAYYLQPKRGFSPLLGGDNNNHDESQQSSNQAHHRALLGSTNRHCYQLVSSKIIEEDQNPDLPARKDLLSREAASHTLLEVKRIHSRAVKMKSVSDLEKLAKLIKKARRQLGIDTDRWLAEAIVFNSYRLIGNPEGQDLKPAAARLGQTPSRVIYTLRLDVSRLKRGQLTGGMPDNIDSYLMLSSSSDNTQHQLTSARHLLLNKSSLKSILKPCEPLSVSRFPGTKRSLQRPVSANPETAPQSSSGPQPSARLATDSLPTRPASSLANECPANQQINDQQCGLSSSRHVQFRLAANRQCHSHARQVADDSNATRNRHGSAQQQRRRTLAEEGERRLWISENLFVSSSIGEDKSLLDVAAALIKIYFSGQWKSK